MKNIPKITFGMMLAISQLVPGLASAHNPYSHIAGWVEGSYYKPSNNGLSIGDLLFATSPGGIFDGGHQAVLMNPKNEYDYAFGGSYRMPHSHTRLFFSYDHYDNHINTDGQIDLRNLGVIPGFVDPVTGAITGDTLSIGKFDLTSHEFRAGVIHDLHFGSRFCLDLQAFFEYDRLRQTLIENVLQTLLTPIVAGGFAITNVELNRQTDNKLLAFGPGLGLMSRWYAYHPCWHLFAGANTTLLFSSHDYSQSFLSDPDDFYIYQPSPSHSVVGKLDIQFGINYHYGFVHEMHGTQWDVSLGMRYLNFFNAFKNGNTAFNPNAAQNSGVSPNFAPNLGPAQDWGRYGPFLKFRVGGAHS